MYQYRRFNNKNGFFQKFGNLDYILLSCLLILGFISLATMYSTDGGEVLFHTKSHFIKFIVFFLMMIVISFINIKFWFSLGYLSYAVILGMLIWTINFGITASGSKRWIDLYFLNLQPSELMKIFIILCLAKYFHRMKSQHVNSFYSICFSLIIIFVPMSLVIIQPDLGTSLLIALSGIVVLWFAGLNHKYFFYSCLLSIISLPIIISFLKPYQKLRVLTFLNPDRDPLGAGYQIIQSKIAIGSGGLFGKGYMNGTQSKLDFLPENHTDFIFSAFGEEFGFMGVLLLITLYVLATFRGMSISIKATDNFSRILSGTLILTIFLYVLVNIGMVIGILPIVGAPLPFMSYGGTSMLTVFAALGIIMSIKSHQRLMRK